MCGIVGLSTPLDRELLSTMTAALAHRGPDADGIALLDGMGLGHRRLKVIDLTETGAQPMSSPDGRLTIVFNGEIYNFRELRTTLEKEGHQFRGRSDTEVLLAAFDAWGPDFVSRLNGMFAFAIWNRDTRTLFLARDRLGVKPLYYIADENRIAFASELKSLLRLPWLEKKLSLDALNFYLTYLYTPPEQSIFETIQKLPQAHTLTWQAGRPLRLEQYWAAPTPMDLPDCAEPGLVEECLERLEAAVESRLVSDAPLGAFLSGGIDSSAIVALMAKKASGRVRTFTIGFGPEAKLYDERSQAKAVADHFNTEHTEIEIRPNLLEILPKAIRHFDEPFGNPTALLTYALSQETKRHVTVALSGDGGDEVFGGYPRYKGMVMAERLQRLPRFVRRALAPFALLIPENSRGWHTPRRVREFLSSLALTPDAMYLSWVGYYSLAQRSRLLLPDVQKALKSPLAAPEQFMAALFASRAENSFFHRARNADLYSFLPGNVLTYGDRMSSAHGLEVREPLLDHRLLEFMCRLPVRYHIGENGQKSLFKKAMQEILPESVLKRPKLGFNPPMGLWINEALKGLVDDTLSPETLRRRNLLDPALVGELLKAHRTGTRDHSLPLYALLNLELWLREYGG